MGIIVGDDTLAVVQGITGTQGSFHTKLMLEYGTRIVAGVTPGKSRTQVHDIPVYDTIDEALEEHQANASIIFVPARYASEAALEAVENRIETIVIITEHIPVKDTVKITARAEQAKSVVIGPNTPGIITPGECKLGIMPAHIFKSGSIGIVSRSGTLTYEIAASLTRNGLGQSTCIGLGGDPITGLNFIDVLEMFGDDPQTKAVVLIGEIGGNLEELTATYISEKGYPKPIVAFIAGRSAPPGKRMGHAGAIIMGKAGTAEAKIAALRSAGVKVGERPSDLPRLLMEAL
ncbi:succinate--CoA ligase subunit alpha [Candidatus Bathyarchaeota archaeon]|nr:succinate--CoA ligase subunit alpha [Candidatus Bathyarchaeota archaeon]